MTFLSHIPIWVLPLFLGLVALGVLSSRDRMTPVVIFYVLPFLGLLSLRATASLEAPATLWLAFVLGYALGVVFGARAQRDYIRAAHGTRVALRGEWLTLTMLMGIFVLNFVKGTAQGVAPEVAKSLPFTMTFAVVAGLLAGIFLGRALTTVRAVRAATQIIETQAHV